MTQPDTSTIALCKICGEPMPPGEEMFNYHGFSGDCPKPPLPKPIEESGWVIEADGRYWDGTFANSNGFDPDHNKAVRFARFEDAEKVKHWLLKDHAFALRTTQHVWIKQ